ncbi:MAG: antibiotic biosynthesis monooxygenase family protein [Candidatus Limnocylindrales bacterium]
MIERHLSYVIRPDRTDDFERFIAERYRPAMSQSPGFAGCELLRAADDTSRYLVVLRFEDSEASQAWRLSPVHEGLQADLLAPVSSWSVEGFVVIE